VVNGTSSTLASDRHSPLGSVSDNYKRSPLSINLNVIHTILNRTGSFLKGLPFIFGLSERVCAYFFLMVKATNVYMGAFFSIPPHESYRATDGF
jgi:hypothetical protein